MKRLATALVLIPVCTYLILWGPFWAFAAVLTGVACLCFHEYGGLVSRYLVEPPGLFGYAAGLLVLFLPRHDFTLFSILVLLALTLGLRSRELVDALPYAAYLVLGVIYVFLAWRFGLELRLLNPYWMLFAVALNWVGDTAAYYAGRAIGRHRLAPRVSPGKSWEGAIASVLASIGFAVVYLHALIPAVPLTAAIALGAFGNIAGQMGDLCESALKRGGGVKDSGTLLPGHGGWLDRLDSSLFSMPVVYFLVTNWA